MPERPCVFRKPWKLEPKGCWPGPVVEVQLGLAAHSTLGLTLVRWPVLPESGSGVNRAWYWDVV
jgi:hypothetical protein